MKKLNLSGIISRNKNDELRRAFAEESQFKAQEAARIEKEKRQTLKENVANSGTLTTSRSSRLVNSKTALFNTLMERFKDEFVTQVVMEALPFDFPKTVHEELKEQIKFIRDDIFSGFINESTLTEPYFIKSLNENTNILVALGGAKGKDVKGTDLARATITANATFLARDLSGYKDAGKAQGVNLIDINTKVGDQAKLMDRIDSAVAELRDGLGDEAGALFKDLVSTFGREVKDRIARAVITDKELRESEANRYTGLSESSIELRRKRDNKKQKHYSLLEELYKTNNILQETAGASSEDYLHESLLQMAVLETYKLFECVTQSDEMIIATLKKRRRHLGN